MTYRELDRLALIRQVQENKWIKITYTGSQSERETKQGYYASWGVKQWHGEGESFIFFGHRKNIKSLPLSPYYDSTFTS